MVEVEGGEPVSRGFWDCSIFVEESGPGLSLPLLKVSISSDIGLLAPESSWFLREICLIVWAAAETTMEIGAFNINKPFTAYNGWAIYGLIGRAFMTYNGWGISGLMGGAFTT